jgi:ribose transport system substrate-binding protein
MEIDMKNVLKQLALLGLLPSLLAVTALSAHAAAVGKRVAVFLGPTQDRFIGTWSQVFTENATAKGMKVTVLSSPWDPALQAQQIDDAVAQKFDLLVVEPLSQKAVIPALTRAKIAKVPVMLVFADFPRNEAQDLYLTYVGENSHELGKLAGEAVGDALKSAGRVPGKVAALTGALAEGVAPLRLAGFKSALAKYPGVELVVIEDVQWNPAKAEQVFSQILSRFSGANGLSAVYGMNDVVANGAVQAAESAGVKLGTEKGALIVVGGNCMGPGVKNIQTGKAVATVHMLPHISARNAAGAAADILDGKAVPRQIYERHEIITKENLAKYEKACSY